MIKKEMIAMLLAGGQGSRLGVLTEKVAKPAVAFGGKYRIIDFPLSNCINSGIDTVGVLTQYQPLRLNTHIGIGIPWDLDRNEGGVTVLPPYEKSTSSEWYTGTANAIFQVNIDNSMHLPCEPNPLNMRILLQEIIQQIHCSFYNFFCILYSFPFISGFDKATVLYSFCLQNLCLSVFLFFQNNTAYRCCPNVNPRRFHSPNSSASFLNSGRELIIVS